jgi:SP family facilitated glucose transporter-like MFS transporter 8
MCACVGFTAPAEKSIESDDPARCTSLCLSEEKWSTFTGAVNIGAVIGAVMGGPLSDRLGRKLSLIAASLPLLIGWVLQGLATGFAGLMTGRIAVGFGIGIVSCVVPMYIAEIAPTQIRGALGSLHEMGIMSGILTVYGLGTDAVPFGWRGLSFTGVVPAAALLIGMFFVPETPHWLITQGAYNDAEVALKRLRMSNNVQDEIREVYEAYLEDTANDETRLHELVDKAHRPALVAAVGLMFVQQLSGVRTMLRGSQWGIPLSIPSCILPSLDAGKRYHWLLRSDFVGCWAFRRRPGCCACCGLSSACNLLSCAIDG